MEIYAKMEKVGNGLPLFNPPPMPMDLVGIAPPRLDHCLLTTENVPDAARFMSEVLGFRLTEQLVTNEGYQLIVFFERSRQPHDIAFTRGANGGLHHFAYWLDSWAEVGRAADILRMNGIDIDIGPTRHGITRGHTIYFFDPVGNRNEVFTGGYKTDTDWETITWTEDQLGKALFYYENRVVESFVSIYT
jgi:catechol 2,3-dioxygenase